MAVCAGSVSSLDRDDVICFIADHEEALKAELRRASRSGHKAEGWQNFLRFVETVRTTAHIDTYTYIVYIYTYTNDHFSPDQEGHGGVP